MKDFIKEKGATILVILSTIILAGIAVFTATKLYQLRQESISPASPESEPSAHASAGAQGTATHQIDSNDLLTVTHSNNTDETIQMGTTVYDVAEGCSWSTDPSCQVVKWTWESNQLAPGESESNSVQLSCSSQIDTYNGDIINPQFFPSRSYHDEDRMVKHTEWNYGDWCAPENETKQCQTLTFSLTLNTPTPTNTNKPTPTDTNAPTPTGTNAPTPTGTNAPTPTGTNAPTTTPTTPIGSGPTSTPTTVADTSVNPDNPELPAAGIGLPTIFASTLGILLIAFAIVIAL